MKQKSGTTLTRNVRFIDGSGWPHKSRGNVPKPEKKVQLMSASESSIILLNNANRSMSFFCLFCRKFFRSDTKKSATKARGCQYFSWHEFVCVSKQPAIPFIAHPFPLRFHV